MPGFGEGTVDSLPPGAKQAHPGLKPANVDWADIRLQVSART